MILGQTIYARKHRKIIRELDFKKFIKLIQFFPVFPVTPVGLEWSKNAQ